MPFVWINDRFIEEDAASVSVRDAGLLHAAGVFTTIRAAAGRLLMLPQHLHRLRESCEALFVPLPFNDADLTQAAGELLVRNALSDARLRLTVTRGHSDRDPLHGEHHRSTVLLTASELASYPAEWYQRGMTLMLGSEQKLNPYDFQAGHKTLDYFSRFAALREAIRRGAGESLWFNVHNFLQSASVANVFLVEEIDGAPALVTPPTNAELREEAVRRSCPYPRSNVLPGIVRQAIIDHARDEGLAVHRIPIDVNRLLGAREVFLTNSIMGVMPVTRLEQSAVGEGSPGEVTRRLMDLSLA